MHGINRTAVAVTLASVSLVAMSACGSPRPGNAGDAKALIESCDGPVSSYVPIDGTASGDTASLGQTRQYAVANELAQVAACGGQAKVVTFSSSSAATVTLFEGRIELVGATDQARARRLNAAVSKVVDQIAKDFPGAVAGLDGGGSDPVAQMRLFGEWATQIGEGRFRMLELTDGLQNVGVTTKAIVADPESVATEFDVPDLSGAEVRIAGIGQVNGTVPPTEMVDALKHFYEVLCQRTGAESCTVISEVAAVTS